MTRHRPVRALAVLAVLSLTAVACGGDDDDASDTAATTAEATADSGDTVASTEATAADESAAEGSSAAETAAGGSSDEMSGDTASDTASDTAGEMSGDTASGDMSDGADLDALVAAAQDEGSLVWYSVPAEGIAQAVSDGFEAEYGISVEFQRLASRDLSQRYAAEADAGSTVADAVLMSNTPFVPDALANGWTVPLADAGIPGFPGDWPADFLLDDRGTAIVSIEPSVIAYNTDLVSEDEAPKEWEDLADPKWAGEIILIDPAASPAYIDFWSVVLEVTSPEVLQGIAANAGTTMPSGVPAIEALGAGEGSIVVPGVGAVVLGAAERGAPVAYSLPTTSNGPEIVALVSADAPHPNAARLFTWYVMYGPGADLLNASPSTASPLTGEDLPPDYRRSPPDAQSQADTIIGLLSLG